MAHRPPTDALGREIRAGDVLWVPGRQSSSLWLERRLVVRVDPPLRGWMNRDTPEEELEGRVLVRQPDGTGRPAYLQVPGRTVREVSVGLMGEIDSALDYAFEEARAEGELSQDQVSDAVREHLQEMRILP